jgi:hypothetical protein
VRRHRCHGRWESALAVWNNGDIVACATDGAPLGRRHNYFIAGLPTFLCPQEHINLFSFVVGASVKIYEECTKSNAKVVYL